ncbi:MAG: hypothetical protein A4E26_01822 [Methanobacterium sp. PtaU1.Bin097]|jgi:hypothetical protein|nr:MAG: hypothetical protein A4E26_01822 [Methanobacterium sp. PtaU1.Bin097]
MATGIKIFMPKGTPELKKLEKEWLEADKVLIRGTVTPDVAEFLEKRAFEDFGMMKKGAIGLELTKLLRVAKNSLEKEESEE